MILRNHYPLCSAELCSSKNSKWSILSQQQHALTPAVASEFFNVEHWERCRLYQSNELSQEKLSCSPATTSNTDSVHFLSDTTALLRDTIALPKWKQQLLFLPSVLSSCVCLLLPGIQQYPLWNDQVAQTVEGQKSIWLSPATFGSMVCFCWLLWAFVSCSVWFCFSRCYSFPLPEM